MAKITETEKGKYEAIWTLPQYREVSPGAKKVELFHHIAHPAPGKTVADLGCGAGAGGLALKDKLGLDPTFLDFVKPEGAPDPFKLCCLWDSIPLRRKKFGRAYKPVKYDFGYCCDVMEHIPEAFVGLTVRNILDACDKAFFSICFGADHHGAVLNDHLHLTVQKFNWWKDLLEEFGTVADARDLLGHGVFYVWK